MTIKHFLCSSVFLCVAVFILTGCSGDTIIPGRANPLDGNDNELKENEVKLQESVSKTIDSIMPQVEAIRGLSFSRPISVTFMTSGQYRTMIEKDSSWIEYEEIWADFWQTMLVQTGFILRQDGIEDFAEDQKDYYAGFPAAFYRPGTDSITIMSADSEWVDLDTTKDQDWFKAMLAHELTHALQDQDLEAFSTTNPNSSDFQSAWDCLVEGDACLVQTMHYYRYEYHPDYVDTWSEAAVAWATNRAFQFYDYANVGEFSYPAFMELPGLAPYLIGPNWVGGIYNNSGWSSVNDMYKMPYFSTNMVISNSSVAAEFIPFDALEQFIDFNNQFVVEDFLGALNLSIMLSMRSESGRMGDDIQAMYGYRGDHLIYWTGDPDDAGSMIWAMSFDNEYQTLETWGLLSKIILNSDNMYERPLYTETSSLADGYGNPIYAEYESGELQAALLRTGNIVWWIENQEDINSVVDAIKSIPLSKKLKTGVQVSAINPVYPVLKKRRPWLYRMPANNFVRQM